MKELTLFKKTITYRELKQAFCKAKQEILPKLNEGEALAWNNIFTYFLEHKGPYITNRVANIYLKTVGPYLELIAIPQRTQIHLFDGNVRIQKYIRIDDNYAIKGMLIIADDEKEPSPSELSLIKFIKEVLNN